MPELARNLVNLSVTAIAANTSSALAAKKETSAIPIIFQSGGDPVRLGLVCSLNQPGGNLTGVSFFATSVEAKRLSLLHDLVPQAAVIAVLANPNFPDAGSQMNDMQDAARSMRQPITFLNGSTAGEIAMAFASLAKEGVSALLVAGDPFFTAQREQIVSLAAKHAIPTMYPDREFPALGGLISYSTSLTDAYRLVGIYTEKILNGAKPADLPVLRSSKFELVINLKTAKALNLTIAPGLLAIADEVIE